MTRVLVLASLFGVACDSSPSGGSSGVPRFSHVFVIVMENTSLASLQAANNTPYLSGLAASAATSSNYHGVAHPSLPNYVAITSGGTSDIQCDCSPTAGTACSSSNCNIVLADCGCPVGTPHLGDQLDAAGKSWRNYGEDMGAPCNLTTSGDYAARHVPFLYYNNVQTNAARCAAHVVDYGGFAADLAGTTPALVMIAPNLIHDMHDPVAIPPNTMNYKNGDDWLAQEVPRILASPAYQQAGVLFIVWDEDDLSGVPSADDPIPFFLLSPLARQNGFVSTTHIDHYSLLATIEDGLSLPRLGKAAAAKPLNDFFPTH